jgi:hypothetical protein
VVTFDQTGAIFWSLDDGVKEVGRARMGESGRANGDWKGRDELWIGGDDRIVAKITAREVVLYEAPEAPWLQEGEYEMLAVDDTGAWWGTCQWKGGDIYSTSYCDQWTWVDLASGKKEKGGTHGRTWSWPTAEPPGYHVREHKEGDYVYGIECETSSGVHMIGDYWGNPLGSYWISTDPPMLLVERGYMSGEERYPERWELYDGCTDQKATGRYLTPGPDGLWIGSNDPEWDDYGNQRPSKNTVYRGGTKLGVIKGHEPRFRPPG